MLPSGGWVGRGLELAQLFFFFPFRVGSSVSLCLMAGQSQFTTARFSRYVLGYLIRLGLQSRQSAEIRSTLTPKRECPTAGHTLYIPLAYPLDTRNTCFCF